MEGWDEQKTLVNLRINQNSESRADSTAWNRYYSINHISRTLDFIFVMLNPLLCLISNIIQKRKLTSICGYVCISSKALKIISKGQEAQKHFILQYCWPRNVLPGTCISTHNGWYTYLWKSWSFYCLLHDQSMHCLARTIKLMLSLPNRSS